MIRLRARTWAMTLAGAAAIHLALAAAWYWRSLEKGAVSTGQHGIRIGLAAAGAPAGAPGDAMPEAAALAGPEAVETASVDAPADARSLATTETAPTEVEVKAAEDTATVQPAETALPATEAAAVIRATENAVPITDEAAAIQPTETTSPEVPQAAVPAPVIETVTATSVAPEPTERAADEAEPVQVSETVEAVTATAAPPTPLPRPERRERPTEAEPVKSERPPAAEEVAAAETATASDAPGSTDPPEASGSTEANGSTGTAENRQAALPGRHGRSGSRSGTSIGDREDVQQGGGSPGERADFLLRLQVWLERHKKYPRRAQRRRQEGTAELYFVMSRDGRVLDYRIRKSSGHQPLDREVEAMIRRAQPLPSMPDFMTGKQLELVVPVVFALK